MRRSNQRRREESRRKYLSPREQLGQLRYVPRALRLVWEAAAGWVVASTILLVIAAVLPVLNVYLTRAVVNAVVVVIESNGDWAAVRVALIPLILMGLVLVVNTLLGNVQSFVSSYLAERTQDHMVRFIHDKTTSVDMQFYESPAYFDQLQRAGADALSEPLSLLTNLSSLAQSTITLLAMVGVLFTFAWWVPLALLLGTLPAFGMAIYTSRKTYQWLLRNTLNRRRVGYYHQILTSNTAAPEMRLFDLGAHFKPAHNALRSQLRTEQLSIRKQGLIGQTIASLISLLVVALVMGWVILQALRGVFNLGDLAMFWQALNQARGLIGNLSNGVDRIYRNLLFLEDLFAFLDLEPQLKEPAEPVTTPPGLQQGIEVKGVTFSYPDSELTALKDFDLTIPSGQIVAIVGENGAGKSTLLKLLCRFYDPQAGSITWDGVDLREMSQSDLRRRITVLFQQPFPYQDSALNNIRFGDLAGQPSQAQVEAAVLAGGARPIIDKLPDGLATMLGKLFGNAELSVGEWQRVALARAFIRQADLVILDEPTSAMDSWAENEWMSRFRGLVDGRTAVIITHRFTTAMQADIIHVMVESRIVESGSHAELVALGGRYAQSWRAQMQEVESMR